MRWNPFRRAESRTAPGAGVAGGGGWGGGGPAPWNTANPENAMRMVAMWGAVRFLAWNIAAMAPGLGLYKLSEDDDIAVRQPTPALFANPSIHGTLFQWIERAVVSMALQGDGIGLVTQRDGPFPTAIEWLNPINVVCMDQAIEGPGSYVDPRWYWWGRPMDPRDLLHIPLFARPWRVRGLSPVMAFADSVGINLAAMDYSRQWYDNGGVPPGTFQNLTQKVLPDDAEEIADRYVRRMRHRKPIVYGMDWKYTPIAINPHEARFLETIQASATQIAVIMGVPPDKVGGTTGDSLTYATVEQNSLDTLTFTFRPWLVRFEYAFSTCFPRGQFVQFNTDEFLRIDAKTRAEIDALSLGTVQTGWKDPNEVRASYNMPPRKDPPTAPAGDPAAPPNGAPARNRSGPAAPAPAATAAAAVHPSAAQPPGTSAAAAQPISRTLPTLRDRWAAPNGHDINGNGHHEPAPAR